MAKDIHNAAGFGNPTEVLRFLKQGVPVDSPDHEGATALARAARYNHVNVAELLVAAGAAVDHRDKIGRTPMHLAAGLGCVEVLSFLIASHANIEATDERGETPLMYAASSGDYPTAQALIRKGARLDAQDKNGYTALIHALLIAGDDYGQRLDLIRMLISGGADLARTDVNGRTAAQIAAEINRDPELVAILQRAAGLPVTAQKWDMIGGQQCVLCKKLARWTPLKHHPDHIALDVVQEWIGINLPGRIKYATGTMYRGKQLIKLAALNAWHEELCAAAAGTKTNA